jgi:hypothetical protein
MALLSLARSKLTLSNKHLLAQLKDKAQNLDRKRHGEITVA